jgi:hypothetical protein
MASPENKKWSVCDGLSAMAVGSVLTSGGVAGVEVGHAASAASKVKIVMEPPREQDEVGKVNFLLDKECRRLCSLDLTIANSNET